MLIFGTAGHINHGKTALVKALTDKIATDWTKKRSAASPLNWVLQVSTHHKASIFP